MDNFKDEFMKDEIKTALTFTRTVKAIKIILALAICYAYFTDSSWLIEIIVISVVISLILPLGFFDTFIQKLLEYNTQLLEERQALNANEANKTFEKAFKNISELKKIIKE